MRFSTKTTYGLRAMIKLAENWNKGSVSLPKIANEEKISLGYLEKLFSRLKKAKLVKSSKGALGGYELLKKPRNTEIYEIIKVLEGKISPFYCLDEKGKIYCHNNCRCGANKVLIKVQESIKNTLRSIKLSDLI